MENKNESIINFEEASKNLRGAAIELIQCIPNCSINPSPAERKLRKALDKFIDEIKIEHNKNNQLLTEGGVLIFFAEENKLEKAKKRIEQMLQEFRTKYSNELNESFNLERRIEKQLVKSLKQINKKIKNGSKIKDI